MSEKTKFQTGSTYVVDFKTGAVVHTFHSATETMDFEKQVMHKKMVIGTAAMCQYPGEQERSGTVIFRGYSKAEGFHAFDAFKRKMLFQTTSYQKATKMFIQFIKTNCKPGLTYVDSREPNTMPLYVISNRKYPEKIFKMAIKHLLKEGLPHGRRYH